MPLRMHGPAGYAYSDQFCEYDTQQCVHCGCHFEVEPITGYNRANGTLACCLKCYGPTCGEARCDPCVPFEQQLELSEKGQLGAMIHSYEMAREIEGRRRVLWGVLDNILKR